MWKKKIKERTQKKLVHLKWPSLPRTGHMCSDAECVGQLELQAVIKKKKKKQFKNRDSLGRRALSLSHECIPEQEPTEAIWYMKIVIFLYSVSVLFPFVEGYSRAQIFVFPFFFSLIFFTCFSSLSGCESFLPCSPLILLDKKKTVCETYCNNKCCFLDVKLHCRWRTKSICHKFYERVCTWQRLRKRKS